VEVPGSIRVVGVDRGGSGFIPDEASTFQQGDIAHFVLTSEAIAKLDVLMEPVAE
jgi:Trk K+ transport system NAD-binding subunit